MAKLSIKTRLCYRYILVQLSNILKDKSNFNNGAIINFNLGVKLIGLFGSMLEK